MGVIFCHVIKIKQFIHESPSIILGNQKWNGVDPIFIKSEELIIIEINLFISKFFKRVSLNKIINKKLIDAIDWIKKYFKDASDDNILFLFEIIGINLNKLISIPIQHPIHEFDEIEIKVLKKRINKKNILLELKFIIIKNNIYIKYFIKF